MLPCLLLFSYVSFIMSDTGNVRGTNLGDHDSDRSVDSSVGDGSSNSLGDFIAEEDDIQPPESQEGSTVPSDEGLEHTTQVRQIHPLYHDSFMGDGPDVTISLPLDV